MHGALFLMVPDILKVTIERKGGILSSSHSFFLTKQSRKKKPSHHKATHTIHKILNKMTESRDKGKKTQGQWNQVATDLGQLPVPFKNTKNFL